MLRKYFLLILLTTFFSFSYSFAYNVNANAGDGHSSHHGDGDDDNHNSHKHNDDDDDEHDDYSIRAIEKLSFGKIVAPNHGMGTVTIDPQSGQKTLQGGVYDLGGRSGAAIFEIRASAGSQFEVIVPSNVKMRPRGEGVEIRDIAVWPTGILRIDHSRRLEFKIGGGMYLPSGVKPRKYRARFSVFINKIVE